jgi:hypothetical protein
MRTVFLLIFMSVAPVWAADVATKVTHEPVTPKPNEPVLVTAKIAPGATKVTLQLQAVAPGKYVRKSDPAYATDWTDMPMHDDGQEGDAKKGDGIFSVRIPAKYQQARWLLRYRIVVERDGKSTKAPTDALVPNYAYWCDAGPTAWRGSREPGKIPALTYSADFLGTLQALHLLARAEDVANTQWDGRFHKQKQLGTIVYRGVVYDHIQYSNRGQGSAHISGKNKWSVKFNDNHDLPFVDHDGIPFPGLCGSLNLNPGGSTPYVPILRGIAGLDEVMSMRAYRLAGVPTTPTTWVQWRVVTTANEVDPKDQFQGDLWGLYVALAEMTPKLLSDRKLPDGVCVSVQSGVKHTPPDIKEPEKVWTKFLGELRGSPNEAWCRANLDLPAYYSFHAMNRLLANVDLRPDGNHGYYRHADGRWAPIPWDNDMMFVPRHHQPGYIDAITCLRHPPIALEYRNRAREILDLFAADGSATGGQVGQFVTDLGNALTPKGFDVTWPKLDEAKWNQHPRMNQKGSYYVNPMRADHFGGPWTRTLATNDFAGFQRYLIDFCTDSRAKKNYAPNDGDTKGYGWGYLAHEAKDDKIPATPTIKQDAGKERYVASAFASPAMHQQGTLEWRVGRVGQRGWYELADHWRQDGKGLDITIPAEVFKNPGVYRVRARWRDSTGRASHWSAPLDVSVR